MLFKRTRLRLTLLSGGITTLILIIMTLSCLSISENNLIGNKLMSYQNDIYTITSNLEQQTMISNAWLSQLEGKGSCYISILDNGVPFLFNRKKHDDSRQELIDAVWRYYQGDGASEMEVKTLSYRSRYTAFYYQDTQEYYCIAITVEKETNLLEMLLIMPLDSLKRQILTQRLLFCCVILAALVCIWMFAWFFIGKLLRPIEESRDKQNQFVAAASHELRTPLAVILSCAEAVLERDYENDKEALQNMSTVKDEALRMSTLLEDMLMLASNDTGRFSVQKVSTELDTLLLNIYEAFEPMAHARQIKLTVSLPESPLPPCVCDGGRIRQVLAILIHNAVSYTPDGGEVALSLDKRGGKFILSVTDSGPGIPDAEKDKIFERFYRGEKSRSGKGHFGLGLSIAREIVSAHHGGITVENAPGGGSVFTIYLPSAE